MNRPVILCGLGHVGQAVLACLKAAGLPVVVVDNRCEPSDPRLGGAPLVRGDCRNPETLDQAGLAEARAVLIVTGDDLINISTTLLVRSRNASARIVVRLFNDNLMARLSQAVKNVDALSVPTLTAPVLALTALTGQALGTVDLPDGPRQVAELPVTAQSLLAGRTVGQVAALQQLTVVALLPARGPDRFLNAVDAEAPLVPGDRLVVCGRPEQLAPLMAEETGAAEVDLLWAGLFRRAFRVVRSTFREIDLPVLIASLVLIGVVIVSTLIFHLGMNRAAPDSLFRTISLIATGGEMHEQELTEPWHKVFVSLMRLAGVALIAGFTAIFTNYLLRARLGPALELRRVPDAGHIVVCGLGNVGYRVVEELRRRGESVVAIERQADNRFVSTARRQGTAVIVGDATLLELLRQANAGTARAVIAATDNPLVNLEIGLLVRELNPKQRVVLRLAEAYLAQVLLEAANIRLAVSTSALAAPAFVAGLFGDRVLGLFVVADRAFAVAELTVQADAPYLNQPVRDLSAQSRFLPLHLAKAAGATVPQLLDHRLELGDILTGIVAIADLPGLLGQERPAN